MHKPDNLPEALRMARAKHGHSMDAAGAVLGVGKSAWHSWEHGTPPSSHRLPALADYIGATGAELLALLSPAQGSH
jgi:transcriptional regulator with XRE-family HTH domain